jgi:hypothetical protein
MHRTHLIGLAAALAVTAAVAITPALAGAHTAAARPAPVVSALVANTHQASLLAVPKFIFHAGLAFGAFHHFIYIPFKAGKFTSGSIFSKIKNYLEAAAAAAFVYHETKLALQDAQQNKVLKLLVAPLTAVVALFNTIVAKVKSHNLDATTISSAQSDVSTTESQAKSSGSTISEVLPSAKQLLAGSA